MRIKEGKMKKLLCIMSLAVLLCFTFACQQGKEVKKDVGEDIGAVGEEIKQFVKEWAEASNTGDLDRIMSMVADSCVRIPPNAPPLIGKEVIRKDQQQFFDLYTSKGDEAVVDFHACGDFAFSRGTWSYDFIPKAGGESTAAYGNFIDIYQKQSDGSLKLFWNTWSDEGVSTSPKEQTLETKQIENDIETAADTLASAISRLDAEGVTNLFSTVEGTKYISDGAFIPKNELKKAFADFYGSLQEMNFVFEKKEVKVLNPDTAVLTSWAHYTAVPKEGEKLDERAIFTSVYLRNNGKWSIFQAHKSFIE
jgi:uncharacterized protein (TIGR02246 family)